MNAPSLPQRALELFDALVELAPSARAQRLQALAAQDPALHVEVLGLLAADEAASGVLEQAPVLARPHDDDGNSDDAIDPMLGQRIGPWRILDIVGRGGMGAVYRGERADGEFQQQAAIKLIRMGLDRPELRRRFLRERQILAQLQHPHIATLLDGGVADNGAPYFAMELVEGAPIDDWCDMQRLDLRERVQLFLQVCAAVQHAHRNLVVHRDLKPNNILVTPSGQAKLLDFGIAKLLEAESADTQTRERPLTPEYAAPEQLRGEPITTATDLYALGVVLYGLLAGTHPFASTARTPLQQQLASLHRDPEPITQAAARLPVAQAHTRHLTPRALAAALRGDLAAIVHRCLHAEPARRHASAESLAADLHAWLEGRPVAARRGDRRYRLRKFVTRHRWGVAASVLALLALSGTTATAVWQAREAHRQAALAITHAERAEAQAARALITKDFAVRLFREADPLHSAQGMQLTVVDLLNAAAKRVDSELEHAPGSQAELRGAIGASLYNLGDKDTGLALVERGLAQLRDLGIRGTVLAQVLQDRAIARRAAGDYAGAESDAREGLAQLEHATGEQALLWRSKLRSTLASSVINRGRYHEGLALQKAILDDRRVLLGESNPDIAVDWNNLGNSYLRLDRYAQAEAAFQRATELMLAQYGPDHPRMIWLQLGLAMARGGQATRQRAAEAALLEAERVLHKTLSATHPIAVNLHYGRGYLLMLQGHYPEAEAAFGRALAQARALHDPQTAIAEGQLGLSLIRQERYPQARIHLAAAIAGLAAQRVASDPQLNQLQAAHGLSAFHGGSRADGESEIRAALQRLQSADYFATDDFAESACDLATLLEASGRGAEAQVWRQRAQHAFAQVLGTAHPRTRLVALK